MSKATERMVKSGLHGQEHLVRLHLEKLRTAPTNASPKRPERKYNIRIRRQDLMLLDELAKQSGRPRSELINELLHRILLSELDRVTELDARVLLALTADMDAVYDPLASHWLIYVLASHVERIAGNVLKHGDVEDKFMDDVPPDVSLNSPGYQKLKSRIEGASR